MLYCLMFISKWYLENPVKVNALTRVQSSVKSWGLSGDLEYIKRSHTQLKTEPVYKEHIIRWNTCIFLRFSKNCEGKYEN